MNWYFYSLCWMVCSLSVNTRRRSSCSWISSTLFRDKIFLPALSPVTGTPQVAFVLNAYIQSIKSLSVCFKSGSDCIQVMLISLSSASSTYRPVHEEHKIIIITRYVLNILMNDETCFMEMWRQLRTKSLVSEKYTETVL